MAKKEKDKQTKIEHNTQHRKLKRHKPHQKLGLMSGALEG